MIGFTTMTRELNGQCCCWCVSWLITSAWVGGSSVTSCCSRGKIRCNRSGWISHVHLIPEEPCAAMTFTNERNISLFAPPPHNHRTMISSFERRAEVSVYWPLNPAIICQAQQYRVQMTVVLTLKECNHSFCKSTSISRNL